MMNMTNRISRGRRSGFTLIELLIVVGIISLLLVVLAVAIMPWLGRSDERRTIALLEQLGGAIAGQSVTPDLRQFRKDAGSLSNGISGDEHTASSQMLLFYLAPGRDVWEGSNLYKNRNYDPQLDPAQFKDSTSTQGGGLPFLVDAWDKPLWYNYDVTQQAFFLYSRGADGSAGSDDDLIYDGRANKVVKRADLK